MLGRDWERCHAEQMNRERRNYKIVFYGFCDKLSLTLDIKSVIWKFFQVDHRDREKKRFKQLQGLDAGLSFDEVTARNFKSAKTFYLFR